MPGCVVVGVRDGRSAATVAYAADVAHERRVPLLAVHAYPAAPAVEDIGWVEDTSWLADVVANEWCHAAVVRGVPHRAWALAGPPAAVLRIAAARARADLVVVGQRRGDERWWRRRSLGAQLANGLAQPLVVVPALDARVGTLQAGDRVALRSPAH